MKKVKRIARKNVGLTLLILLLAMRFLFSLFPSLFEIFYFDFWFPKLRAFQSYFYWMWVLPGYLLLILGLITWIVVLFIRRNSFKTFLRRSFNLLAFVASLFLICFGIQYADPGIAERMNLGEPPESIDLLDLYYEAMENAQKKRNAIVDIDAVNNITELDYNQDHEKLHQDLILFLREEGYKSSEVDVIVQEIPHGVLRRLGISGIYNPFTGECNVEGELPNILLAFTIAHEMSHAAGITSEAEANFAAWISLSNSDDAFLNYAAAYYLWRKVAKHLNRNLSVEEAELISANIPKELQVDRMAIYELLSREKPLFPEFSDKVNDTYLKLQGVEAGVEDYDKFLEIYLSWKQLD